MPIIKALVVIVGHSLIQIGFFIGGKRASLSRRRSEGTGEPVRPLLPPAPVQHHSATRWAMLPTPACIVPLGMLCNETQSSPYPFKCSLFPRPALTLLSSTADCVVNCFKFVSSHAFGLTVTALSSYDPKVRAAGYHILTSFYPHLEGTASVKKRQVNTPLPLEGNILYF